MAQVFDECTVALSGTFPGYKHGDLNKLIKDGGGKTASKVSASTTHLVVTDKDFNGDTVKVKDAKENPDIKIIGLSWLVDSSKAGKKLAEDAYSMDGSSSQTAPQGTKRTRDDDVEPEEIKEEEEEETEPSSKKQKDGQKLKSSVLSIPVDEICHLQNTHRVYVADDGTIFDASLNQTNAGHNNNKFYRIQVLENGQGDFRTWTRWGRVGESGQNAILGAGDLDEALYQFEKKFKDKSGHSWADRLEPAKKGKYTFIERSYEPDEDEDEDGDSVPADVKLPPKMEEAVCKLPEPVQQLMQLIFNQQFFQANMADMSYDADKLPLGKLSKRTLTQGYQALKDLAELFADPTLARSKHDMTTNAAIEHLSNTYYTVIPHNFGRNRPPIIRTDDLLKRELNLLETLSDMSIADGIIKDTKDAIENLHPLDRQYNGLKLKEMTPLDHKSKEFKLLEEYMIGSHGKTHRTKLEVQEIFRIERDSEKDRFSQSPYASLKGDRRLLWHGSRATNFGGILSQGLRIAPPEAPVNGYMFGKGVYLADISSKSAGYCAQHISGGVALLLLCEAELGKPMLELTMSDYHAAEEAKKQGRFATWGKGRTAPRGWKGADCVHPDLDGVIMPDTKQTPGDSGLAAAVLQYNEYICYDIAQIRLRYLFRVRISDSH